MKKYRILIVDDLTENLKTMVSIFKDLEPSYQTFQTNNSRKALNIAIQTLPDLIISDWDMPNLSGLELIRKLKNSNVTKDIPVIMATGVMLSPKHLQIALNAGAIDYIRKPINPVELISRTKAALLITSYYRQLIEQQNQELAKNTLHLIKNKKNIIILSKKIEKLINLIDKNPEKAKIELQNLNKKLQQESKQEIWVKFNLSFSKIHASFSTNLTKIFPTLTPSDIRLCSFVRLGMSNKEISSVMICSPNTIKVARYRLRKKIKLEKGINLENFLCQF